MRRTDTKTMGADLIAAVNLLRPVVLAHADDGQRDALATIETFCAIALRVIGKANPSKVRAEAIAVELQSLIPPGDRK